MLKSKLRQWHPRLGVIFCLALFMSAGSGLLHIVMTYSQKAPPKAGPDGPDLDLSAVSIAPVELIQNPALKGEKIRALNLRLIANEPWYLVYTGASKKPVYIHARTGQEGTEDMDEQFAAQIASQHLGRKDAVKTAYLTEFNREYLNIFRILPVYRFDVDDGKGTRVYVSTMTESVTRHTDNWKQFEANIFSNFHKLAFIPDKKWRDIILGILTFGVFIAALSGLILFSVTKRRKNP